MRLVELRFERPRLRGNVLALVQVPSRSRDLMTGAISRLSCSPQLYCNSRLIAMLRNKRLTSIAWQSNNLQGSIDKVLMPLKLGHKSHMYIQYCKEYLVHD